MITASDILEDEIGRDPMGTLHDGEPGPARVGQAIYGALARPAYACGCQPAIHRFRCAACRRVVGWCYGGHSDCFAESECCNSCVVALWRSAQRLGIAHDDLRHALDHDRRFRERAYALLHRIFGAVAVPDQDAP